MDIRNKCTPLYKRFTIDNCENNPKFVTGS